MNNEPTTDRPIDITYSFIAAVAPFLIPLVLASIIKHHTGILPCFFDIDSQYSTQSHKDSPSDHITHHMHTNLNQPPPRTMIRRSKRTATTSTTTTENPLILLSDTGFTQHQESSHFHRWKSFLSLPSPSEYLIPVENHQIWRRHLAWSHREGGA